MKLNSENPFMTARSHFPHVHAKDQTFTVASSGTRKMPLSRALRDWPTEMTFSPKMISPAASGIETTIALAISDRPAPPNHQTQRSPFTRIKGNTFSPGTPVRRHGLQKKRASDARWMNVEIVDFPSHHQTNDAVMRDLLVP